MALSLQTDTAPSKADFTALTDRVNGLADELQAKLSALRDRTELSVAQASDDIAELRQQVEKFAATQLEMDRNALRLEERLALKPEPTADFLAFSERFKARLEIAESVLGKLDMDSKLDQQPLFSQRGHNQKTDARLNDLEDRLTDLDKRLQREAPSVATRDCGPKKPEEPELPVAGEIYATPEGERRCLILGVSLDPDAGWLVAFVDWRNGTTGARTLANWAALFPGALITKRS